MTVAASLYNREFYALVKRRLTPQGVLQQWMQLHHVYLTDVLYILGSVRSEFRYVWLYLIGGQGMIVAANDERAFPQDQYLDKINRTVMLKPLLDIYGGGAHLLAQAPLLDPEATDRLLSGFGPPPTHWVSTDDNLLLEYSAPKGNVLDGAQSFHHNVNALRQAMASAGS